MVLPPMRANRLLLLLPLGLAACGGGVGVGPRASYSPQQEARWAPPGPPADPWGPYIREAGARYSVPERWIRVVMRQESGGHQFLNGQPITSSAGAMGLMQLMPGTYEVERERLGLGSDPYDPHDNILAGTALIAELYAKYGSPGFLAAYNASPTRVDAYLASGEPLPEETINYLASTAPLIGGAMSGPLAAYADTGSAPAPVEVAEAPPSLQTAPGSTLWSPAAPAPAPAPSPTPPPVQTAALASPPAPLPRPTNAGGFSLIPRAYADTPPQDTRDARWGVQVGAFSNPAQAERAAETARGIASSQLAPARTVVGSVTHPDGQLFYRARLIGVTEPAAGTACGILTTQRWQCLLVPPGG